MLGDMTISCLLELHWVVSDDKMLDPLNHLEYKCHNPFMNIYTCIDSLHSPVRPHPLTANRQNTLNQPMSCWANLNQCLVF